MPISSNPYFGGVFLRFSFPEVMTLNIVRIFDRTGDLKTFHKIASLHYRSYFPNLTNYENFMKAFNKAVGFIAAFIQVQLYLNQELQQSAVTWIICAIECMHRLNMTMHRKATIIQNRLNQLCRTIFLKMIFGITVRIKWQRKYKKIQIYRLFYQKYVII